MPQNTDPILIDHFDDALSGGDTAGVNAELANDESVATEWAFLKLAVDTIGLGAIRDKVVAARAAAKSEAPVVTMAKKDSAVVRPLFANNLMRIAVVAVLILGVSAVYRYSTVSGASIYNNQFSDYDLSTLRGNDADDNMETAYRSRNWSAVISAFNSKPVKTNKSYFLAGMAQLEMKRYPAAVQYFETVLANNSKTGERFFKAETEYYLALAYLMNNQGAKGVELIRKIRSDVYHPYYPLASKIPATDLKIVELKK